MKKNFLNLEKKFSDFEKSKIIIVSFPFEKTTSYLKGTKFGPEKIINASSQVELFDEEEWFVPSKIGISTLIIKPFKGHEKALKQLEKIVKKILDLKKFPIILGGEHSITIGSLKAVQKFFKKFTLLQFDAHADLRDSWLGLKLSHAAVMRRCLEIDNNINLVQVGVRNISEEELPFFEKNKKRIKTFWAKKWQKDKILKFCQKNIFLTFDFDVLDPSIMPSVGTPEPAGLDWDRTLDLLKMICQKRKIICADFVEFRPIKDFVAPDFLAAKLIYKFISYLVKFQRL